MESAFATLLIILSVLYLIAVVFCFYHRRDVASVFLLISGFFTLVPLIGGFAFPSTSYDVSTGELRKLPMFYIGRVSTVGYNLSLIIGLFLLCRSKKH